MERVENKFIRGWGGEVQAFVPKYQERTIKSEKEYSKIIGGTKQQNIFELLVNKVEEE